MAQVEFAGSGGDLLSGEIDRPAGRPRAWALFAHCFTCGKNLPAAATIARTLAAEGIAVLRFDFTGLGKSSGDFSRSNVSSNVAGLVAVARWLEQHEAAPQLLLGHSLGGAAVLAAAGEPAGIKAVARPRQIRRASSIFWGRNWRQLREIRPGQTACERAARGVAPIDVRPLHEWWPPERACRPDDARGRGQA